MLQHREQRVGIFVDISNLYHSAKYTHHAKVNFKELLRVATGGRRLVRALAYAVESDQSGEGAFHHALENVGFEVRLKHLQVFPGGAKKGDWDIGLAMDIIGLAHKLDVIVLVSGDGDFVPLVQYVKHALGCRVEVIAFGSSASGKLREEADAFLDLDAQAKRFLIPFRGAEREEAET